VPCSKSLQHISTPGIATSDVLQHHTTHYGAQRYMLHSSQPHESRDDSGCTLLRLPNILAFAGCVLDGPGLQ
jgi:hypothetical protein